MSLLFKECKREKVVYKTQAIRGLSVVLEANGIDKFAIFWEILMPILKKVGVGLISCLSLICEREISFIFVDRCGQNGTRINMRYKTYKKSRNSIFILKLFNCILKFSILESSNIQLCEAFQTYQLR